jgi:penicillin-binding protein 2
MQEHQHFKNYYIESRTFVGRVLLTTILIVGLTSLLLYRYYSLQITHHQDYATQSDNNRILVQTISPQRGLIFDANGKLLADNRPSYILSLVPENIKSIDIAHSYYRQ